MEFENLILKNTNQNKDNKEIKDEDQNELGQNASQENTPTDGSDLNADNYLCDLEKRLTDMENDNNGSSDFMISYI